MKDWTKQSFYSASDFLMFLSDHDVTRPNIGYISSGKFDFLFEISIPGFQIVHPENDLISASGYGLDHTLQVLAKHLAGKKIQKIYTCPPPKDIPEPIEIPIGFGRTEADIIGC